MQNIPLVLGTAQLGLPYGIANTTGQPDVRLATEIVREAWNNGIREFDTAQGYGQSEQVLGQAFAGLGITQQVKVISKFDPKLDHLNEAILSETLDDSLTRLGVEQLYCLMLHREEFLPLWNKGLGNSFRHFVQSGKVQNVGISVSSPEKAIQALNTDGMDLIQIPGNILDRRFEKAGVFQLAQQKKKKVHIRSIFLQGLLLIKPPDLTPSMIGARPFLEKIQDLCQEMKLTPQEIALGYFKSSGPEVSLVFGAETVEQVQQNMRNWQKTVSPFLNQRILETFSQVPDAIVNPALWPK